VQITPEAEPLLRHVLAQARQGVPRSEWIGSSEPEGGQIDGLVNWLLQEGYLRSKDHTADQYILMPKAIEFLDQWEPREPVRLTMDQRL
jgi:hypothetical protein